MTYMNAGDISEFVGGYHGTCMETALAVAIAAIHKDRVTADNIISITAWLRDHGIASGNGATTIAALAEYCRDNGIAIASQFNYAGDTAIPFNMWHQLLLDHAGSSPIVLEMAHGGRLTDVETGAGDERAVQYHGICVLGKQVDGYVCADGDNADVPVGGQASRYQIYSLGQLMAAQPCGILMLG